MSLRTSEFRVIATGLQYPEGPVYQCDGSILLVEIGGQCLTQVFQDGRQPLRTPTGGGPNGAAIGPDKAVYLCNDGGMLFMDLSKDPHDNTLLVADSIAGDASDLQRRVHPARNQRWGGGALRSFQGKCASQP